MTVRGNRADADAERELAAMVAAANVERAVGVRSSVGELLEAWFAVASTGWAPTTIRQTRSVLDGYLHPHLGPIAVGDVTPAMIDATYAQLRRCGGLGGRPLAAGTLTRVHVVLRAALAEAMRWGWIWDNPAERAHCIVHVSPERVSTTLDKYAHAVPGGDAQAAATLWQIMQAARVRPTAALSTQVGEASR